MAADGIGGVLMITAARSLTQRGSFKASLQVVKEGVRV